MPEPGVNLTRVEGTFPGSGGLQLYYQCRKPEAACGTVGIVHGVGEHSGRYGNVVEHLTSHGFAVYGYDLRGHGRSPGRRIHMNRWDEYREDLAAFLQLVQKQESPKPLFVYGHSMGALITVDYLIHRQPKLNGAILSGIPLQPAGVAKAHLVAVARVLSNVWPTFTLSLGLDHSALSRDPQVVKAYGADPLVSGRVTVRWGTESLAAISRVKAQASKVGIPILVIHGEADRLNLPGGSRGLFEAIAFADKTLRIYPETYHEPHNDLNYATVLSDTTEWLTKHL